MRQEPPTIRRPFEPQVATVEQLATLLAYPMLHLERIIHDAPTSYTSFRIPKSSGGFREIRPPVRPLREAQRGLLDLLQACIRYPRWMTGGVPKRSIFDHAKPHLGRKMVATFDVKSFYPSTKPNMVLPVLERFGLGGRALDAVLRMVVKDDELPQGGPTSGFLANLAIEPADRRIDSLCRKRGLNFTRYIDDMALSGDVDLQGFRGTIIESIEACQYVVAPDKVRFMGRDVAQIVTKLRVNDKLRPTKEFIADVKEMIWVCLKIGAPLAAASEGITVIRLKNSLTGKVGHIIRADPEIGHKLRGMLCGVPWKQTSTASELLPA